MTDRISVECVCIRCNLAGCLGDTRSTLYPLVIHCTTLSEGVVLTVDVLGGILSCTAVGAEPEPCLILERIYILKVVMLGLL